MALLQLGSIVTSISGKVGGQSFVNGSQGTYLKNHGNIKNTATPRQSFVRSNTSALMQHYRTLSTSELQSWQALVGQYQYKNRVGEVKSYNAFQIYMFCNQGRLLMNEPLINTGLNKVSFNNVTYTITSFDFKGLIIQSDQEVSTSTFILWCTSSLPKNIENVDNRLRKISVMTAQEFVNGYDFTSDYLKVFPNLNQDQRIGFAIEQVDTDSGDRNVRQKSEFFITTN